MIPSGADERTVGNEARVLAPAAGRGLPVGKRLNCGLLDREEGRERHQVFHVCARSRQNEFEGGVVHSLDVQLIGVALDAGEHVAVVGSGQSRSSALPGVLEVSSGKVAAVGPLQTVLQRDRIGQTVVGNGVAGGTGGLGLAFCVVGVQTGECRGSQAGAVNGGVQSRVQIAGLGSEVGAKGVGAVGHLDFLEELRAEQVCVHTGDIVLHHVDVVVVVERQDAPVGHQDVLCFVHQLGAVCKVGLGFDFRNQLVILRPVSQRIDKRIADEGSRIGNFFRIGGFSGFGGFGGGAFGRAGLGLGAGCFGLGTSSAERNDHHSHKQQRKDLFHFLNLLFYFALLPAPPVRISLGVRRSKNITSFASGLSRSVHRMIPRDSISRQVSIRLFVRFAGFSRSLFLTFYAYLFQHATK